MVLLTIQFLLLLEILTKRRIEHGQSEDSHFYSSHLLHERLAKSRLSVLFPEIIYERCSSVSRERNTL